MSDFSFDIVSRIDTQSLADAVNQAQREISTRFDLKNSRSSIELAELTITIVADDDMKLRNVTDILQSKCVKRGVSLKALQYGKAEPASGGTLRQTVTCAQGIAKDQAKKITEAIKDTKLKVGAQIQDEQIRVSSKSKDDLQKVMALVKGMPLDFPVQFVNYR
jgi:cyclic-di-GMP-binding protein